MEACREGLVSIGWLLVANGDVQLVVGRVHAISLSHTEYVMVTQFLLHTKEMVNQVGISTNTTNS